MGRPHLCGVSSTISPSSNEKAVTALPARTMSALGQKQTSAVQKGMSALPPKADIEWRLGECPLSAISGHYISAWG